MTEDKNSFPDFHFTYYIYKSVSQRSSIYSFSLVWKFFGNCLPHILYKDHRKIRSNRMRNLGGSRSVKVKSTHITASYCDKKNNERDVMM